MIFTMQIKSCLVFMIFEQGHLKNKFKFLVFTFLQLYTFLLHVMLRQTGAEQGGGGVGGPLRQNVNIN